MNLGFSPQLMHGASVGAFLLPAHEKYKNYNRSFAVWQRRAQKHLWPLENSEVVTKGCKNMSLNILMPMTDLLKI